MKKHFQTTGIIIRKVDFNEADRIVTVLTSELGKIDCIAKGARRITSKFCGRLDLFYHVQINCFQGRDLAILNEANLLDGFADTKDINKHRILFYVAELTNRLIQSGQHIDGAYPLLLTMLNHLEATDKTEILLHGYIVKLLTIAGFLPTWNKCSTCNTPLALDRTISLDCIHSNVICHNCANPADRIIEPNLIKWVNFMQNYPLSDAIRVKVEQADSQYV